MGRSWKGDDQVTTTRNIAILLAAILAGGAPAHAQQADAGAAAAPDAAQPAASGTPAPLVILFPSGSSTIQPQQRAVLDHASRAYNEGKPIVMVLTGSSDRVGSAQLNLTLSQKRAAAVLKGLLDRGIPADRFQILAKGETELSVATKAGVAEGQNRRVEISWH